MWPTCWRLALAKPKARFQTLAPHSSSPVWWLHSSDCRSRKQLAGYPLSPLRACSARTLGHHSSRCCCAWPTRPRKLPPRWRRPELRPTTRRATSSAWSLWPASCRPRSPDRPRPSATKRWQQSSGLMRCAPRTCFTRRALLASLTGPRRLTTPVMPQRLLPPSRTICAATWRSWVARSIRSSSRAGRAPTRRYAIWRRAPPVL